MPESAHTGAHVTIKIPIFYHKGDFLISEMYSAFSSSATTQYRGYPHYERLNVLNIQIHSQGIVLCVSLRLDLKLTLPALQCNFQIHFQGITYCWHHQHFLWCLPRYTERQSIQCTLVPPYWRINSTNIDGFKYFFWQGLHNSQSSIRKL